MITKNDLLNSINHEINVSKHIFNKIPATGYDYRPTAGQRSTLELLQYLSICGIGSLRTVISGDWADWRAAAEKSKSMEAGDFPAAMDSQLQQMREALDAIEEEVFETRMVRIPTGQEMTMNLALIETTLKFLVAYRMQLFLYGKSIGGENMTTYDCWAGIDTPVKEPVAAEATAEEAA